MEYLNKQNEQNDEHRNSSLANTDNQNYHAEEMFSQSQSKVESIKQDLQNQFYDSKTRKGYPKSSKNNMATKSREFDLLNSDHYANYQNLHKNLHLLQNVKGNGRAIDITKLIDINGLNKGDVFNNRKNEGGEEQRNITYNFNTNIYINQSSTPDKRLRISSGNRGRNNTDNQNQGRNFDNTHKSLDQQYGASSKSRDKASNMDNFNRTQSVNQGNNKGLVRKVRHKKGTYKEIHFNFYQELQWVQI